MPIDRGKEDTARQGRRYCQVPAVCSATGNAIRSPKPPGVARRPTAKETIIRIQADIRPAFHRLGQDVRR